MGFRIEWADEDHLIMNAYVEAPWTWDQFMAAVDSMFAVIRLQNHPCGLVIDISRMGNFPKGDVMSSLARMEKMMPENVFASSLVGAPYAASVFLDILFRIRPRARRRAFFAKTMSEASQKIMDMYKKQQAEVRPV